MKLKLTEIETGESFEAQSGTCDLCMGSPYTIEPVFYHFQADDGQTYRIEDPLPLGWGDYLDLPNIENVPHFASWLSTLEFSSKEFDFADLVYVIDFYDEHIDKTQRF